MPVWSLPQYHPASTHQRGQMMLTPHTWSETRTPSLLFLHHHMDTICVHYALLFWPHASWFQAVRHEREFSGKSEKLGKNR